MIYLNLDPDVQKVESLVNEIEKQTSSPSSAERLNAVEHLLDIHQKEYIPDLVRWDHFIRESLISIGNSKVNLTMCYTELFVMPFKSGLSNTPTHWQTRLDCQTPVCHRLSESETVSSLILTLSPYSSLFTAAPCPSNGAGLGRGSH